MVPLARGRFHRSFDSSFGGSYDRGLDGGLSRVPEESSHQEFQTEF